MRVIAGQFKGRRLFSPPRGVRPALDQVKEAVFNILAPVVEGAAVLDLFAGTGSIGIEALSRGARSCTFVESQKEVAEVLRRNLERCRIEENVEVLTVPVERALPILKKRGERYDLLFVDPPYDRGWVQEILPLIGTGDWSFPGSTMVVEHSPREKVDEEYGCWRLRDQRVYGQTRISFLDSMQKEGVS